MIRIATPSDIGALLNITKACARHMISNNIFQWNDHYPNKNAYENNVRRNELYVLEDASQLIGCIVISTHMDEEYIPVKWLTENKNNIYIHRVAVHPKYQGKGYAQQLMNYAEDYGRQNRCMSIRLDTFSQNGRNQRFYEKRGYKRLGSIYFPKQSEHPFYCYEHIL